VFNNPSAKVGSDIADILGKVDYIGINDETSDNEMVVIRDAQQINEMVDLVLSAPVNPSNSRRDGKRYFISFHLKDGSEFKEAYWLESGKFSNGIMLPVDFGTIVKVTIEK